MSPSNQSVLGRIKIILVTFKRKMKTFTELLIYVRIEHIATQKVLCVI